MICRPQTARGSQYFGRDLADQFNAALRFDHTKAVRPLDPTSEWERGERETYPFGV